MAEPDAGPESGLAAEATAAPEERAGRGLPRGAAIGLAAAVVLAGVLAVVLLTSGGTDDPDSTGAATSGTSRSGELVDVDGRVVPLATAEDFLDACATSGGTPGKCTCVLEGLAARVTVDELERGDLDPTVQTEVEQACTAGGR